MQELTYSELTRHLELFNLYLSGDKEQGVWLDRGIFVDKLIQNMTFPHIDHSASFLTRNSIFRNVIFDQVSFFRADLNATTFENCVFSKCRMYKCEIISSILSNTVFHNCSFPGAEFFLSKITNTLFDDSDFRYASIVKCDISNSILQGKTKEFLIRDNIEKNVLWNLSPIDKME